MAWSRVSGATLATSSSSTGTSYNMGNLGANVAVNDRIIASVSSSTSGPVTSITDDMGNTWVQLDDNSHAYSSYTHQLWTAVAVGSGAVNNITLHKSVSSSYAAIAAATYSGLDTSGSPLDLLLWALTNFSSTADSGTTSGTTGAANELKIGAYADRGVSATPVAGTLDTTYTMDASDNPTTNLGVALESADSGASGSTARATMTSGDSGTNAMYVAVFKLAAAGGFQAAWATTANQGVGFTQPAEFP